MRRRGLQQFLAFLKLELHGVDGQVPEEQVGVDAGAVNGKDILEGVEHVFEALQGRVDDFSDNRRAYLRNLPASHVRGSQSSKGLYRES